MAPEALLRLDPMARNHPAFSPTWRRGFVRRTKPGSGLRYVQFSSALSNQKFPLAHSAALNPMATLPLPEQMELHRDRMGRRDEDQRVESAIDAERSTEDAGLANTLTDARRPVHFGRIKVTLTVLCSPYV